MTIANLSPKLRSQVHGIQLVSLCKSTYVKKYGLSKVLNDVTKDMKKLEEDGLDVGNKYS